MWAGVAAGAATLYIAALPPPPPGWPDSPHWQSGRLALAELEADARLHPCALDAVLELHASCDEMSEDDSVRLALALTNCHRVQSGRDPHPCNVTDPIATCISPLRMTEPDFGVFTAFRLKVDSICHFVALEATQHRAETATQLLVRGAAQTAQAVTTLGDNLDGMSERMDFSSRVMVNGVEGARDQALLSIESLRGETEGVSSQLESILESSMMALDRHVSLAQQQTSMHDDVLNASAMLSAAMDDHALSMQRGWHEGLSVLKAEIKELVLGYLHTEQPGFLSLDTLCFFVASTALGWALTSSCRTRAARNVWFALLLLELALERGFLASIAGYSHVLSHSGLWACRRAAVASGCVSVICAAWQYMDPASALQAQLTSHGTALQEHGSLLREIQRQQSAMHDEFSKCLTPTVSLQSASGCRPRERSFGGRVNELAGVHTGPENAKRTFSAAGVDSAARDDHKQTLATAAHVAPSMSYREVQRELKRRGLKAQGNMEELRLRLLQSSALGDAME